MTAYIKRKNAGKQRELAERRGRTLVLRIQSGRPPGELAKAAEDVRHAELQVLKALLHGCDVEHAKYLPQQRQEQIAQLQSKSPEWARLTVDEIIKLHS